MAASGRAPEARDSLTVSLLMHGGVGASEAHLTGPSFRPEAPSSSSAQLNLFPPPGGTFTIILVIRFVSCTSSGAQKKRRASGWKAELGSVLVDSLALTLRDLLLGAGGDEVDCYTLLHQPHNDEARLGGF